MGYRRALWQLKEAGWFENAKGFLLGRPLHFDEEMFGQTCLDSAKAMLGELNVPVIADIDLGHVNPKLPLISGAYAKVRTGNNELFIEMELK